MARKLTLAVFLLAFLAALTTAVSAADFRWTVAFAQGTTEATIRNARGSSLSFYCPSGQADTAPGMFIQVKTISPKAGEAVAVTIVIDGKSHSFDLDEIQFKAEGPAKRSALSALIDALTMSKGKTFVVEFPKFGMSERFSLLGARKAMTSATELLDGCGE